MVKVAEWLCDSLWSYFTRVQFPSFTFSRTNIELVKINSMKKKYYLIYKTTNIINNMFYIGCHITNKIDDGYLGSGTYLKRAINKQGKENFKREVLFIFSSEEEMYLKEKEIVDELFLLRPDTYNLMPGGESSGFYYINKNNLNPKDNIYKSHEVVRKYNDEEKKARGEKISNALGLYYQYNEGTFINKKHTEETKRKIGEKNSIHQEGEKNSQFGTCWIMKDGRNKKIKKENLEQFLKDDWKKGRKMAWAK